MDYFLFGQAILKTIVDQSAKCIILGIIDCDKGLEQIKWLTPQVKDAADIGKVGSIIQYVKPTNLPAAAKV